MCILKETDSLNYVNCKEIIRNGQLKEVQILVHASSAGNDRMARLWNTAILAKWKPVYEFIPIERRIDKIRQNKSRCRHNLAFHCYHL